MSNHVWEIEATQNSFYMNVSQSLQDDFPNMLMLIPNFWLVCHVELTIFGRKDSFQKHKM